MNEITNNEMNFVLKLFKNPEKEYNANSISKELGISPMGALKIAKRLENENIIGSKELGKAKFFKLKLDHDYVREYLHFLLKREKEQASPHVKVWFDEIKKLKSADAAILFGSVLRKNQEPRDIDVVLITDRQKFSKLKNEVEEINQIGVKKIHPIFQTKEDFIKNIRKGDKIILSAIKGMFIFGEDAIIGAVRNEPR